jgi:hypothetical protein
MDRILDLEAPARALPTTTPVENPAKSKKKKPKPDTLSTSTRAWATFGVVFTLVLSAGLNGYSNAQHSPVAWAGWLMGIAVPVIVLTLAKVCGEKYRSGQKPVAWFAGGSGVALLFLSVWHCSQSIALLTGSPVALALPLAVAIDCGLVACEIALISEPRE